MSEDIVAGIRNAMDRGASLDEASQSFINAGYNPLAIQEAEEIINGGVTRRVYPESTGGPKEEHSLPATPSAEAPKKKSKGLLILVVILAALVFLGALSYLIYVLAIK